MRLLLLLGLGPIACAQIDVTGIGVRFATEIVDGLHPIAAIVPWSPAEEAGLQPGDIIAAVNGRSLTGLPIAELTSLIRGHAGELRELRLTRPERTVSLAVRALRGLVLSGDAQNGEGVYKDIDGSVYTGRFVQGFCEGEGVCERPDFGTYRGKFVRGKFEGYGALEYRNGDRYSGDFKAGKREGKGSLWLAQAQEAYSGMFANNEFHGPGTLSLHGPSAEFTGTFQAGQPVEGTLTLRDGPPGLAMSPRSMSELRLLAAEMRRTSVAPAAPAASDAPKKTATPTPRPPVARTLGIDPEPSAPAPSAARSASPPSAPAARSKPSPPPRAPCAACCGTGHELARCTACRGRGVIESVRMRTKTTETPYVARSVYDQVGRLIGSSSGYDRRTEQIREVSESPCHTCVKQSGLVLTSRTCRTCAGQGIPPSSP